jgi:hypothetical protein
MREYILGSTQIRYEPARWLIWAEAIAILINHGLDVSELALGIGKDSKIQCVLRKTDLQSLYALPQGGTMCVEVTSESQLLSPSHGGNPYVYGILHELIHLLVPMDRSGLVETAVDFFCRFIMKCLWDRCGSSICPDRYNYIEYDVIRRKHLQRTESPALLEWIDTTIETSGVEQIRAMATDYLQGPHTSLRMVACLKTAHGEVLEELKLLATSVQVGCFVPAKHDQSFGLN